jgi:hypothetical protein
MERFRHRVGRRRRLWCVAPGYSRRTWHSIRSSICNSSKRRWPVRNRRLT